MITTFQQRSGVKISDLDCDNYSSSLHKWLFAPHGLRSA